MIDTKHINALMRRLEGHPPIIAAFLTNSQSTTFESLDNLITHNIKDSNLYTTISGLYNDGLYIVKYNLFNKQESELPMEMIVELEGMSVVLKNIGGEFVFGVVLKQGELAAARILVSQVMDELDKQLRMIIEAAEA